MGDDHAWVTPMMMPPVDDQHCPCDHVAADQLAAAEDDRGEQDAEQRLCRDERADDGDARSVESLVERRVREAPEQPGRCERRERPPDVRDDAPATYGAEVCGHHRRPGEDRRSGGELRVDGRVLCEVADDVVAGREEGRRAERKDEADPPRVLRAVSLAGEREPSEHDQDRPDEEPRMERARGRRRARS